MINISGLEPKQYNITPEGIKYLQEQLEELKQKRAGVADQIREITSQSTDLGAREDSTFAFNQNQATELDGQIYLLERIIGMAHPITKPDTNDHVQLGSQVTVDLDGKEQSYALVGPVEANPLEGRISDESPFGQSLLGKKLNDKVEVVSPTNQRTLATIVRID